MTGRLGFYDEATAWGVIVGEDGCLYAFRGSQAAGPLLEAGELKAGETVTFEPQPGAGGLRAVGVRRIG